MMEFDQINQTFGKMTAAIARDMRSIEESYGYAMVKGNSLMRTTLRMEWIPAGTNWTNVYLHCCELYLYIGGNIYVADRINNRITDLAATIAGIAFDTYDEFNCFRITDSMSIRRCQYVSDTSKKTSKLTIDHIFLSPEIPKTCMEELYDG